MINKIVFFIFVLFAIEMKLSFWNINILFFVITLFFSFVGFFFFIYKRKWGLLKIGIKDIKNALQTLAKNSVQFTILQILSLFSANIDMFIVSNTMGLKLVGDYSLVKRIYLFVMSFHVVILFPLWPAFTEAFHKRDYMWPKRMLSRIVLLTIAIFLFLIPTLTVFGDRLVFLWTGKDNHLSFIFFLLGIYMMLGAIINCYSVLLNSIGKLFWQIIFAFFSCVLIIPISSILMKGFSISGLVIGLILISLPFLIYVYVKVNNIFYQVCND